MLPVYVVDTSSWHFYILYGQRPDEIFEQSEYGRPGTIFRQVQSQLLNSGPLVVTLKCSNTSTRTFLDLRLVHFHLSIPSPL